MAFKMKGSYHYGKNPLKQKYTPPGTKKGPELIRGPHKPKRDGSQDLKPIGTYKPKPGDGPKPLKQKQSVGQMTAVSTVDARNKKEKEIQESFNKTLEQDKSKKVAKHPLYDKLPSWAKTAYNKLSAKERANVNKNKSESQLLNSLGDYTPKFEGGDQIWHLNKKRLCFLKPV